MENVISNKQQQQNRTPAIKSHGNLLKLHIGTHKGIREIRERNILIQKDTRTPMFIAALFTIAKIWKQPKCPSADEWIKKM